MQVDPAFRDLARSARRRRRRRNAWRGGTAGVLAAAGLGGALWYWQPALPFRGDDQEVMVQVDDGIMVAPPVLSDAFADIPGDPMVIAADSGESPGTALPGPPDLDPARVGPPTPARLTLLDEPLYSRDRRLIAALPTTREDFALFKAQRSLAARAEAGTGAASAEAAGSGHSSHVYLRDSSLRSPAWRDLLLQVQVATPLTELLESNGFAPAEAARIAAAAGFVPESGLAPGSILALRFTGEAPARRLLQLSLYDGGLRGALARATGAGVALDEAPLVPASDAWFGEDIQALAGGEQVGAQFRLLDVVYSAALRGGLSVESVGELVAMMAEVHDLDAYAAPGDRLELIFAPGAPDSQVAGRILYAGIDGPSGKKPCYVVEAAGEGADGWRCFAPGARVIAADAALRMLMPVAGRIKDRYSSATPFITWRAGQAGPVVAPAAGRITEAGPGEGGQVVVIAHGDGVSSRLMRLDSLAPGIAAGATVSPGQALGSAGAGGEPAMQVLAGGAPVDPMPYLTGTEVVLASDAVESLINRIVTVESAGNARARNPLSSATGLGQFIESTWLRMMGSYRPDLVASLSRQELLDLRFDPALSREMVRHLAQENEAYLRARGHAISAGRLYLAHFLGPGGADQVLSADPAMSVAALMGPGVVRANPFLASYSCADLRAWADRKMSGAAGALPAGPPPEPMDPAVARFVQAMDAILAQG